MQIDPQQIQDVFGVAARHIAPLGACSFGAILTFDAPTCDISRIFCYGAKLRTYNSELCSLVDKAGVLVLANATATGLVANLSISAALRDNKAMKQDPFHRDSTLGFSNGITTLLNQHARWREAPTLYATDQAVRTALRLYQQATALPTTATRRALQNMIKPSYSFNLMTEDAAARRVLLEACPTFTSDLAALIPDTQKYVHYWNPQSAGIVMHSNRENFILHARPESQDWRNPLLAIGVRPFD